jgi:hypothetical protein
VPLLADEGAVGRLDEVLGKRREHRPDRVVEDGHEDAHGPLPAVVPEPRHFDLIQGAAVRTKFIGLRRLPDEAADKLFVRQRAKAGQEVPKDRTSLLLIPQERTSPRGYVPLPAAPKVCAVTPPAGAGGCAEAYAQLSP